MFGLVGSCSILNLTYNVQLLQWNKVYLFLQTEVVLCVLREH